MLAFFRTIFLWAQDYVVWSAVDYGPGSGPVLGSRHYISLFEKT